MFDLGATGCSAGRPACRPSAPYRLCRWRRRRDGRGPDPWRASPSARARNLALPVPTVRVAAASCRRSAPPPLRQAVAVACGWPRPGSEADRIAGRAGDRGLRPVVAPYAASVAAALSAGGSPGRRVAALADAVGGKPAACRRPSGPGPPRSRHALPGDELQDVPVHHVGLLDVEEVPGPVHHHHL